MSNINKLRIGSKIIQDNEPCVITENEFVNPGKGQSFHRVKFRKLVSGKILERTFKSSDSVELANIKELNLMYLYNDRVYWYFMNLETYEQVSISVKIIKDNIKWLIEKLFYIVTFWDNSPIFLIPPRFIELKVIDIQSVVKGNTVVSSTKLAILSTGVVIKVPLFIKQGEFIKVNTRSSEYVSRIIK